MDTNYSDNDKLRLQLQEFQRRLNADPDPKELDKTPDGNAHTLPISYVEMTLDELYLGLWDTQNFKWSAITNEVQGSIELVVIHPITGREVRRTGAASIVITVDSLSKDEKEGMTKQARNLYALNPENKKPNALDLGFPKLKAECIKNAAQSLGKIFGRDVNRKKVDQFKEQYKTLSEEGFTALVDRVKKGETQLIAKAESTFILNDAQKDLLNKLTAVQPKQLNGAVK
jgi:hypothetical protein